MNNINHRSGVSASIERPLFQKLALRRKKEVFHKIEFGLNQLGLSHLFKKFVCSMDSRLIGFKAKIVQRKSTSIECKIQLVLSPLFYLKAEDFEDSNSVGWKWIENQMKKGKLTDQDRKAIIDYYKNKELSDEALDFVIYHELGHVKQNYRGLSFKNPKDSEIDADKTAYHLLGSIEGGIYFFSQMGIFHPDKDSNTHPSFSKRMFALEKVRNHKFYRSVSFYKHIR